MPFFQWMAFSCTAFRKSDYIYPFSHNLMWSLWYTSLLKSAYTYRYKSAFEFHHKSAVGLFNSAISMSTHLPEYLLQTILRSSHIQYKQCIWGSLSFFKGFLWEMYRDKKLHLKSPNVYESLKLGLVCNAGDEYVWVNKRVLGKYGFHLFYNRNQIESCQ
jgi:hypothetical protein